MPNNAKHLRRLWLRVVEAKIPIHAGNASFFLFLAMFPAVMLLMTLLQYTSLTADDLTAAMESLVPSSMMPLANYLIGDLFSSSSGTLLSVSAVSAVWLASKGVLGVLNGLNAVYCVRETRGYLLRRLISMVYMVGLIVALLLTLVLHVFGQRLQSLLSARVPLLGRLFSLVLHFRVVFLIGLLTLIFTSCFLALPNHKIQLRSAFPGALLSAVGWVLFSTVFSFYVNHFSNYSSFYGSITTIAVAMLWLYFCMNILFYGALANALLDDYRTRRHPHDSSAPPSRERP